MGLKDKKRKKRRKSATEVFSHLNTTKSIEHGTVTTNPKSKIVKWVFGGVILASTIVGISVPWALSSCTAKAKLPINDSDYMYTYMDSFGNEYKVTWKEFENRVNSYKQTEENAEIKSLTNILNSSMIVKLYNEERDAFFRFKAIMKAKDDKEIGNDTYGYDVSKTVEDVRKEQSEILYNNKKNLQKTLGNNFLDKWMSELKTNSIYGLPDLNEADTANLLKYEQQAIEYMKVNAIKKPALARFELAEINTTQWKPSDLAWNNINEIKYKDSNDVEQTIAVNTAGVELKSFLTNNNTKVSKGVGTEQKLAVFQTKSYVFSKRMPNKLFKELLPKYYNSAVISSIDLAIKPGTNNSEPFSFENTLIENLFKINNTNNLNNFVAFLQLSKFKGAQINNDKDSNIKDAELIKALAGSKEDTDISKKLGSSQNKVYADLLAAGGDNEKNRTMNIIALGSDGAKYTNEINQQNDYQIYKAKDENPFNTFMDLLFTITSAGNVQPNFAAPNDWMKNYWDNVFGKQNVSAQLWNLIDLIKNNFEKNGSEYTLKNQYDNQYNDKLKNYTGALQDSDKKYLGSLFAISLIDKDAKINNVDNTLSNQVGYWSLYKLSNETFLHVNKEGMKVFTKEIITEQTKNNLDVMITSDLERTLDEKTSSNLYYNVAGLYAKINNDNIINLYLLSDDQNAKEFKDGIKKELNLTTDEQVNEKFNLFNRNAEINITSLLSSDDKNVLDKIDDLIKTNIDDKKYYEFTTIKLPNDEQEQVYWQEIGKLYDKNSIDNTLVGLDNIQIKFLEKYLRIIKPFKTTK